MTGPQTLTYMATDIIGYSLLIQKDQRKTVSLIETYRSLLIPVIKHEGGSSIVCIADAITACFSSCQAAVRAGFAIQKALSNWNHSSSGPKLATRIGLHTSAEDTKGHLQQLSKTVAKSLESLGSAKALNVSFPVMQKIQGENWLHCYPLGSRSVDYLPDPLMMFYLFENRPGFFYRLGLKAKYLKHKYSDQCANVNILAATASAMVILAVVLLNSAVVNPQEIEFLKIIDLSEEGYTSDLQTLSHRLNSRLADISIETAPGEKHTHSSATRLICSFQKYGARIRLTWAFFDQAGEVQISGGEVSGKITELKELENRLIENIISHVE